ncbi:hypothetical protein PPERSA_11030 [Pseudocohnilembus persalinus]|uniref:Transmembrane protein n=1 Tax=Pseudocohnilembus persalinus TaxID=266149 RepID=A0A0V0QYR1_PSEPJ|nr:hypothetical protein PPERSA_11030 [Pseudocohnilembus persalinus]|eukprot:KRX07481.1 hypothetical protein PPERSA_11030 [Pseudocohnilembus persalinus]
MAILWTMMFIIPLILKTQYSERLNKVLKWYNFSQIKDQANSEQYIVYDNENNIQGTIFYQLMKPIVVKNLSQKERAIDEQMQNSLKKIKYDKDEQILFIKDLTINSDLDKQSQQKVIDFLIDNAIQFLSKQNQGKKQATKYIFFIVNSFNLHVCTYLEDRHKFTVDNKFYASQNENIYGNLTFIMKYKF